MSVCFGREVLQHRESRTAEGASPAGKRPAANVFMARKSTPIRMELALLAIPLLAIVAALFLLPNAQPGGGSQPKVTLRVTSITPPPNPELAREEKFRREQIRFALSKVAASTVSSPSAGDKTGSEPVQLASLGAEFLPAGKSAQPVADISPLAAPRDIRPSKLKRSLAHTAHAAPNRKARSMRPAARLQVRRKAIRPRARVRRNLASQSTAAQWISASLKWPAAAANATIAPVKRTLTRTVSRAGGVLETLKEKVL